MSYLGLKGSLQRAEGPGRRDDGGKARHGWWVGVEELRKQTGRKYEDGSVFQQLKNSFMRQWRSNITVIDEAQHSVRILQDGGKLQTTDYMFHKLKFSAHSVDLNKL